MNYKKIYDALISKRQKNPVESGYAERHHIIPRCLGGSNAKSNLVRLSAREHWIAHLLLTKIYSTCQEHYSMLCAAKTMARKSKNHKGNRDFIRNSRMFQIVRERANEASKGFVTIRDKNGKCFNVSKDDPRYLSGELVGATKGLFAVRDKNGNSFSTSKDDPRYLSGELVSTTVNSVKVRDKDGNYFNVSKDDPRYLSGELVGATKDFVILRDKNRKIIRVSKDDPRYLSGELKGLFSGRKHSKATVAKMRKSHAGQQAGSKNSQYGTRWISNLTTGESRKISKESAIPEGWIAGRKIN